MSFRFDQANKKNLSYTLSQFLVSAFQFPSCFLVERLLHVTVWIPLSSSFLLVSSSLSWSKVSLIVVFLFLFLGELLPPSFFWISVDANSCSDSCQSCCNITSSEKPSSSLFLTVWKSSSSSSGQLGIKIPIVGYLSGLCGASPGWRMWDPPDHP